MPSTVFSKPENDYLFKVYTNTSGDTKFEYVLPEQLSSDDLPAKGTKIKVEGRSKYYGLGEVDPKAAALSSKRNFNIHLYPWDTKLPELSTRNFGIFSISSRTD